MNRSETGKNVRKAAGNSSRRLFGIMKPSKSPNLKIPKGTEHVGNVYLHEQTGNILRELESQKSRALAATQFRLQT